jgi:hypothetical protein
MASHLALEEPEVIAHMHRAGKTQIRIAQRRLKLTPNAERQGGLAPGEAVPDVSVPHAVRRA